MASADARAMTMSLQMDPAALHLKRKRSPSHDHGLAAAAAAPLPKTAKTHNHLQINYLARQLDTDLPLITNDDTLPNILSLLGDYQGVLDRHESMACNLGARPLGPILIKRFERLFDGPPRVLKTHGKDGTTVTWLDVVEFARNKPEQFQLGQMSEGVRVCQFYTKQCRVQISEEDFVLISSGIPQKMIPPQPIVEDEEKELGTLDILERNLAQICQLADQVAARTRQLNHRLKGRKQAILDRRASAPPAPPMRASSPSNVALMNGAALPNNNANPNPPHLPQPPQPTPGGFVAVNARPHHDHNRNAAAPATQNDLMAKFHTITDRRASSQPVNGGHDGRRPSVGQQSHPSTPVPTHGHSLSKSADAPSSIIRPPPFSDHDLHSMMNSPVPIPHTPSSLLPATSQRAGQPQEKDDGGPFKAEMVHRMENLCKGERILPPCDRCRRLHMDCLKNLTACMGCTKKHAKCAWREVREAEVRGVFSHLESRGPGPLHSEGEDDSHGRASTSSPAAALTPPRQGATTPMGSQGPGPAQHAMPPDTKPAHRLSPGMDRDTPRGVEAQLQEAAQSSLAHANARLGAAEGKSNEFTSIIA